MESKPSTEDILNAILPLREWVEDSKCFIQYVSKKMASRTDVTNLKNVLNQRLMERQARDSSICPVWEEPYSQCFDEFVRQITIDCPERGLLLMRIRDEIKMTRARSPSVRGNNCSWRRGKAELEARVAELQKQKTKLENKKSELVNKKEALLKMFEEKRAADEGKRKAEIDFLDSQGKHLQEFLKPLWVIMKFVLALLFTVSAAQLCPTWMQGDEICDHICMTPASNFDSGSGVSDCSVLCSTQCSQLLQVSANCAPTCDTWECEWGYCPTCVPGCAVQSLGNGVCDLSCDIEKCGFDYGDCGHMAEVYVTPSGPNGDGSISAPFADLADTLTSLWYPYNTVFLLNGVHHLNQGNSQTGPLLRQHGLVETNIQALLCQNTTSDDANCVPYRAVIRLTHNFLSFFLNHTVTFRNVDLYGDYDLKLGCFTPRCVYCPYLRFNATNSTWVDDRGNVVDINEAAEQSICNGYWSKTFMLIGKSGNITLANVSFKHFKQQLSSLITNQCGDLQMLNVDFVDDMAAPTGLTGGLIQIAAPASALPYYCGSITYTQGLVYLLNNGYEYRPDIFFTGFMYLDGVHSLSISNVTFTYNMMVIGADVNTTTSALISLNRFRQVQILSCVFNYGIGGMSAVLYINSHVDIPMIPINGVASEHLLIHLLIQDTTFIDNASQQGATIEIDFHNDHQNVQLTNLMFVRNFAHLGAIVITNDALSANASFGEYTKVANEIVFVPPRGVIARKINITDSFSESVITCSNIGNVELDELSLLRNGQEVSGVTSFSYIIVQFILNLATYILITPTLNVNKACNGVTYLSNVLNLTLQRSVFSGNYCPLGTPGIQLTGETNFITLTHNNFTDNTGPGAITLTVQQPITMSNMFFQNNTNLQTRDSACVSINMAVASDITVIDSQFEHNTGQFSSVMYIGNTRTATLIRVLFDGNKALFTCAGVLFNPYAGGTSSLMVVDSIFRNNAATTDGVITIIDFDQVLSDNQVAIVQFSVTGSEFRNNTSAFEGACVSLGSYIKLSMNSEISSCVFLNNTSKVGAGGYFTFDSGILCIDSCKFAGNSGPEATALHLNHFPSYTRTSLIRVTNSDFQYHTGAAAIYINGYDIGNDVTAANNTFIRNFAGAYQITGGNLVDANSVYTLQEAHEGPVFYIQLVCNVVAINLTAYNNRAVGQNGGVFYLTTHSHFEVHNSTIFNNSAVDSGGILYLDENSNFQIFSSEVYGNRVGVIGSALYISPGSLLVRNCSFHDNYATKYGVISVVRSSANITNSSFYNNTSSVDSPGIILSGATLILTDSLFQDQTGLTSSFLFGIDHNSILIDKSLFWRGHSTLHGGAIKFEMGSTAIIQNSEFVNCSSDLDAGAVINVDSALTVINSTFLRSRSTNYGGALYSADGSLTVQTSFFQDYYPSAIYTSNMNFSIVSNSVFQDGRSDSGGAIEYDQSTSGTISNNIFINNTAKTGGAVFLGGSGRTGQTMFISIENNQFANNSAANGGAIYCDSLAVTLTGNVFSNNSVNSITAGDGAGGGVWIDCNLIVWCEVQLVSNKFEHNTASLEGGAIYWTGSLPNLTANIFSDNKAPYGLDIASYPIVLAPVSSTGSILSYANITTSPPTAQVLSSVASGQASSAVIVLGLFDQESVLVSTYSTSTANMEVADNASMSLSGNVRAVASGGLFLFKDFIITATPGTTQYLLINTDAVDLTKKKTAHDPKSYYSSVQIQVKMRACVIGESKQGNTCFVCSAGTYSLDPTLPCMLCPDSAICYGNFTMVPKPGYWRATNDTANFIPCLASSACIGSPDPNALSLTGLCASGYTGNLCQTCTVDHSRTGSYQCAQCPSRGPNIAITTLIILAALTVITLIVFTAIRGASRPRSLIAIYFKIFMNYLQMVVVSSGLNLNWPSFVETFLNGQAVAGGVAEQLFSFECLLQDVKVTSESGSMYFIKVAGVAALPLVLFILSGLTWVGLWCCFGLSEIFLKFKATVVVILFILLPTITKSMFSYFACMDLGTGQLWLISDLSVKCWDSGHVTQIVELVLPSIGIWIIGLPVLTVTYLFFHRTDLDAWKIRQVFSFLYKGYERPYFYWEFVILYRKVVLIAASVFLTTVNIRVQALSILALLLVALFAQIQIKPFNDPSLNKLEVKSILVSAVTIYAGLYYNTENISKE